MRIKTRTTSLTIIETTTTPYFFYKQPLFLAEPGKEIEITTSKLTTMCLKNQQFQPMCAYKLRAYKKIKCIMSSMAHF